MYIIGITGGSGSGKTTFTEKVLSLVDSKDVGVLHQDSYYLPRHPVDLKIGDEPNFDHPEAFDWPLFRKDLALLRSGKKIESPVYDYGGSKRTSKTTTIGPCKVLMVEGIFTLWDEEIRRLMDLKFYLHVESDIRFIRRLFRDLKDRSRTLEDIIKQYYEAVRPMHQLYLEPTKQYADIIVGEETDTAATMLAGMIKQKLYETKAKKE
jgi:uridine kinase